MQVPILGAGQPARFAGANAYWLGLDENVLINGSKVNYPTHFRVDDAFETAAGMGALVIRAHTVGVSTGNPLSFEPQLGVFAEGDGKASDHIDYAVYRAGLSGIRLIVPLTDNYAYSFMEANTILSTGSTLRWSTAPNVCCLCA